uniref:Uncharacterized protein n=1 Tax=Arundo donax TaxID=35708 RepID=A0A0A8ZC47_ARUDO
MKRTAQDMELLKWI